MCIVIAGVRVLAVARAGDMLAGNNGQDQGAGPGDNTGDTEQSANIPGDGIISSKRKQYKTSRPTSESSSKELNLGCKLNQTWTRPDLNLT